MPPPASQVDWEMTVVMPLGVLANQLIKMEADLRFLSMRVVEYASEVGSAPTKAVDARLELIHDALDSIKLLVARFESDVRPKGPALQSRPRAAVIVSTHKPSPERDD